MDYGESGPELAKVSKAQYKSVQVNSSEFNLGKIILSGVACKIKAGRP